MFCVCNQKQQKQEKGGLAESFRLENFIPGLIIGFIFGLLMDLTNPPKNYAKKKKALPGKPQQQSLASNNGDQELKMVWIILTPFLFDFIALAWIIKVCNFVLIELLLSLSRWMFWFAANWGDLFELCGVVCAVVTMNGLWRIMAENVSGNRNHFSVQLLEHLRKRKVVTCVTLYLIYMGWIVLV